jgi:hypothetical protein
MTVPCNRFPCEVGDEGVFVGLGREGSGEGEWRGEWAADGEGGEDYFMYLFVCRRWIRHGEKLMRVLGVSFVILV